MAELDRIKTLEELWEYTANLHLEYYPGSDLEPIMGGGRLSRPKYMFVFINPTYRNISSGSNWVGSRRPWTGTKYIWRIFRDAGHFDDALLEEINNKREWDVDFADVVYEHLSERGFYFTNIVKWTGENADLPKAKKINLFLPILRKEIEIVDPQYVVAFGHIPFKALTNEKIRFKDYYSKVMNDESLGVFKTRINDNVYKVIPSYFPVGRGNPKRATEILKLLP